MLRDLSRNVRRLGMVWIVLVVVAVAWGLWREGDRLTARSEAALARAGVAGVEVTVHGRDVVLRGVHPDEVALQAVASVDGVRRVEWASAAPVAEEPSTTAGPTSTTSPPTTTTPTTTTMASQPAPHLIATLVGGELRLGGAVPDPEAAARVAVVADLIYAPYITNELAVDTSLPMAEWVTGTAQAVAVLPILGEAGLDIAGDQAVLTGKAGTDAKRAMIEGAVQAALGPTVTIDNRVEVTNQVPPLFTTEAAEDGSVVLGGILPDQATIDRILAGAAAAYGPEHVTDQMVVGDGIESTFSLFRIPLIFTQFRPITQWSLHIENDVITGALRGGATFPFGSASLTPELEALLDIATGILLRNPSLAMTIEGHTDSIGSDDFNFSLSEARAESAAQYLVAAGIDPTRLATVGYGESRPIADNGTDAGRAKNRRVEFGLGPRQGG